MNRYEIDECDGCHEEFLAKYVDGGFCPECWDDLRKCENEACGAVYAKDDGECIAGIWLCPDCAAKFGQDVRHIAEMCR